MLSVRDDGIGIPERQLDQIWQRFYQVDPAVGTDGAPASGSQSVRQIARLHGGTVTVQSAEGWGGCFTLRFPMNPAEKKNKIF